MKLKKVVGRGKPISPKLKVRNIKIQAHARAQGKRHQGKKDNR